MLGRIVPVADENVTIFEPAVVVAVAVIIGHELFAPVTKTPPALSVGE
jgi:hypothetical protein